MPIPILTYRDICAICGKRPQVALNRPHSQHKTKRLVRPNLMRWEGMFICARCRKSINKPDRVPYIRRKTELAKTTTTTLSMPTT